MDEQSKNRWFYGAIAISIFNPIPCGIIMGILLLREPNMKQEGRTTLIFSLLWGLIMTLIAFKYGLQNTPLPK